MMKDEDVKTMMDRLGRKLGPGEFVVALVFAGRVKRHFGANGLTVRLGLVERRAQALLRAYGEVREIRSPLRDNRTGKEAGDE